MNTTRPLSGRGKEINYWFQGGRTIVQWGTITFSLRSEDFAAVLDDFFVDFGPWYLLGASMTDPPADGLGHFVAGVAPALTPRHAPAIAAIMVNEQWLEHRGLSPIELRKTGRAFSSLARARPVW